MAKARILFVLLFPVIIATMLFTASCSGPEYPKEIAQLDSIRIQLDSTEASLNSIDSAKVIKALEEVNTDLHEISLYYNRIARDSMMDHETATKLTNYRSVRKAFGIYKKEYPKLKKDLDYSHAQIANLMHDLEKNLVDEKDVAAYVQRERTEAIKVMETTAMLVTTVKGKMERYDEVKPWVEEYMKELEANKAANKKKGKK